MRDRPEPSVPVRPSAPLPRSPHGAVIAQSTGARRTEYCAARGTIRTPTIRAAGPADAPPGRAARRPLPLSPPALGTGPLATVARAVCRRRLAASRARRAARRAARRIQGLDGGRRELQAAPVARRPLSYGAAATDRQAGLAKLGIAGDNFQAPPSSAALRRR